MSHLSRPVRVRQCLLCDTPERVGKEKILLAETVNRQQHPQTATDDSWSRRAPGRPSDVEFVSVLCVMVLTHGCRAREVRCGGDDWTATGGRCLAAPGSPDFGPNRRRGHLPAVGAPGRHHRLLQPPGPAQRLRRGPDQRTGELRPVFSTAGEPDGVLLKACGNRRASRCRSCSAVYRADTWQLVAAGLRGGKGMPESVAEHPRLFVTLTAPSFGPVHSRRLDTGGRAETRAGPMPTGCCPHGRPLRCQQRHGERDPLLGSPICADCFDYESAVLWNAVAPELWRRTTIYLHRALAGAVGLSRAALSRQVRLSFTKVAEYQARGSVHFHAVLRLDAAGPGEPTSGPPARYTAGLLARVVRQTVPQVSTPLPTAAGEASRPVGWGHQLDVRVIDAASETANPTAIAAYVAKYATKSSTELGHTLDTRLRTAEEIDELKVPEHVRRLVEACWRLGAQPHLAELAAAPLGAHARLPRPLLHPQPALLDHPHLAAHRPGRPSARHRRGPPSRHGRGVAGRPSRRRRRPRQHRDHQPLAVRGQRVPHRRRPSPGGKCGRSVTGSAGRKPGCTDEPTMSRHPLRDVRGANRWSQMKPQHSPKPTPNPPQIPAHYAAPHRAALRLFNGYLMRAIQRKEGNMLASNGSSGSASEGQEPLWRVADVAAYLGIPVNTLYQWRYLGTGPRSYKVGRWVRYDPDEVRKWLGEHAAA